MQALNFLKQQPLISWFDFVCDQTKLWQHLENGKIDPSPEALIQQLCAQAQSEEKESRNPDTSEEDIAYCISKAKSLRILALKILAFRKWDLRCIVSNQMPMALQKQLLDELLIQTRVTSLGGGFFNPTDEKPPMSWQSFAAVLFSRWSLLTVVHQKRPKPPAKPTVSNPLLQPDANLTARDLDLQVVAEIEGLREAAVEVLESFCERAEKLYFCVPVPECFNLPISSEDTSVPFHKWEEALTPAVSEAACQVHYDLGVHNFFVKKYPKARSHFKAVGKLWFRQPTNHRSGYYDIDISSLTGYCDALKISAVTKKLKKAAVKPIGDVILLKRLESSEKSEDVVEALVKDNCQRHLSLASRALLTAAKSGSIGQVVSVKCSHWMRCWLDRNLSLRQATSCLANDGKFPQLFCQGLLTVVKNCGAADKRVLSAIWRFLLSSVPNLSVNEAALDGLMELLGQTSTSARLQLPLPEPYSISLTDIADPQWELLNTYGTAQKLRMILTKVPSGRASVHWHIPPDLQSVVLTLPSGLIQDSVGVLIGKSQQMLTINEIALFSRFLSIAEADNKAAGGDLRQNLLFGSEELRGRLWHWHEQLQTDLNGTGARTPVLSALVKGVLAEIQSPGSPQPNAELWLQFVSFLLNTGDWDVLLAECRLAKSPYLDFAKLLAALCYEITKGGENVSLLSREFFNLMLATMVDTSQAKRTAAGNVTQIQREPTSLLLTRNQFASVTKFIKEPLAISILMSFMIKLFNSTDAAMFVPVYSEYTSLWPKTYKESANLNLPYLKDMLETTMQNAILVNPINAFWLRSYGDYECSNERYLTAMRYYMQSVMASTDWLNKPLPENVIDAVMITNMMKCCSKLMCHTQEALLSQLLENPDYPAVLKALETPQVYDGMDCYYQCIWDMNLLELLVFAAKKKNLKGHMDKAIQCIENRELNSHNPKEILAIASLKRRQKFLRALALQYL